MIRMYFEHSNRLKYSFKNKYEKSKANYRLSEMKKNWKGCENSGI